MEAKASADISLSIMQAIQGGLNAFEINKKMREVQTMRLLLTAGQGTLPQSLKYICAARDIINLKAPTSVGCIRQLRAAYR